MRTFLLFVFIFISSVNVFAHNEGEHRSYQFIENKGQFEKEVQYKAKINGGALFIEKNALTFHLLDNSVINKYHLHQEVKKEEQFIKGHAYKMIFENSIEPKIIATEKSNDYTNYFLGNDPSKWVSEAYSYKIIRMKNIYSNIDVEITTNENENLKYTYYVKANANASVIQQKYEGIENLKLVNGNLILTTNVNEVKELKPIAWQMVNGKKEMVECNFVLNNKTISYNFPKGYNTSIDLIIDPVLIFGSYTGSTADNFGMTATYDSQGNLITGGTAFNIGFPTTVGAYDITSNVNATTYGVTDIVITKFNSVGTNLVFSTYIGGGTTNQGTETVHSLICDANDNLFLFGLTSSTDFPTTPGCYDNSFNGGSMIGFVNNGTYFYNSGTDIYVSKFNPSGTNLLASTYIGGSDNDGVNYNLNFISNGNYTSNYDSLMFNYGDQFRGEIMVDDLGNCYVATTTRSADFPTVNAYQSIKSGKQDAVAFKFDANLANLTWSTFIGGNNKDAAYSIKVDENYVAYIAGGTSSPDFPITAGSLNTTYQGGKVDGFILKLSANGSAILSSSYIGTASYDQCYFVELDRFGGVYLLGQTQGTATYPIVNVAYSTPNSGQFVTKLNNALSSIIYSTLFGNGNGGINISPSAFLVDVCGNVYVSGWGANILQSTPLNGMDVSPDAIQPLTGDGFNFYLIVFSRDIQSVLYASYFGGPTSQEHVDGGTSRFDANGVVYQSVCAGCGSNDDFPTTPGAWSNFNLSTNCNNGVFKYDFEIEPDAAFITSDTAGCAPLTLTFDNTSPIYTDYFWDFGNNDTTSTDPNPTRTFPTPGNYTVYLIVEDSVCGLLLDTALQIITVYPALQLLTTDTANCVGGNFILTADALGTSSNFYWSSDGNFTDTLNSPITDSTLSVNITGDTTFYVSVGNGFCTYMDTVEILIPIPEIILSATGSCAGDTITVNANNISPYPVTSYDFGPDSLIISENGSSFATIATDYDNWIWVIATSAAGCTNDDSTFINVQGPPSGLIQATADQYIIGTGFSTVLHASPSGYTYSWTPASTLDNPNSQNPTASPTETTTYIVSISNNGCLRRDTVVITIVDALCEEPYIFVPNAFTPNGDGENDKLFVRGLYIETLLFRVYNRWGEKVWETTDQTLGWDGTFQGRDCDPAVFDYYYQVTCPGGAEYFKKGNITLIR